MKKIYLLIFSVIITTALWAQTVTVYDGAGSINTIVIGTSNYLVSESIYTEAEIGAGNFTTAGSAIQRINFFLDAVGTNPAVNNYRVYMKNVPLATTTFTTGAYTTAGYTLVFNGVFNATPVGLTGLILTTPFVRTTGTNLEVLIERMDNVVHTGYVFEATLGNSSNQLATSSRQYSGTLLPVSGVTSLTATAIRPAIQFIHTFPVDASVDLIDFPNISCYSTPQTVSVYIFNEGTTNIAAGAASTTLHIRGANNYSATQSNTAVILPGAFEIINFTGVGLSNLGDNMDTAYINLPGDGTSYNDTIATSNSAASTLSTFPVTETVEEFYPISATSNLDVFPYSQTIAFGNLWFLGHGDYFNDDQTVHLAPLGAPTDSAYYIFDSYEPPNSTGVESRLFSNCIDLSAATGALLTFSMSHDTLFSVGADYSPDSLYVSVSVDKGVTWIRLQGFARIDLTLNDAIWRTESVNLNAYAGQTIQIGFEGVSKFGNAILLDNINIAALLPVSLLNFDAQRNGKVNDITWTTSQEANTNKFIVERSTDGGQNFKEIAQVAATGNSSTVRNYGFTDVAPVKGINYYRLRIVDLDNSSKYSVIKNVKNLGTIDFTFAPNPVLQSMKLMLDVEKADKGSITITDMSGKPVYNSFINVVPGNNILTIETGSFSQGTYIITVQTSDERLVKKFTRL